jgi:hypothetical protein
LLDFYPKFCEPLRLRTSPPASKRSSQTSSTGYKSRNVFAFHNPETLLEWLEPDKQLNSRLTNRLTTDQIPTTNLRHSLGIIARPHGPVGHFMRLFARLGIDDGDVVSLAKPFGVDAPLTV